MPSKKAKSKNSPCTIVNAVLLPGDEVPWKGETFRNLTGLSELGFLDPDYIVATKNGRKITDGDRNAISSYISTVSNSKQVLTSPKLNTVPNYKAYKQVAQQHFSQPGNLNDVCTRIMEDHQVTYTQVYREYGLDRMGSAKDWHHVVDASFVNAIWGEEGLNSSSQPHPAYTRAAKAIFYRLWDKQSNAFRRKKKKRAILMETNADLQKAWEKNRGDQQLFREIVKTMRALRKVEYEMDGKEAPQTVAMRDRVESWMDEGDHHYRELANPTARTRKSSWSVTCTKEEIAHFRQIWMLTFAPETMTEFDADSTPAPLSPDAGIGLCGAEDLGVSAVCSLTKPELYAQLGIPEDGNIPGFRNFERCDGEQDENGPKTWADMDALLTEGSQAKGPPMPISASSDNPCFLEDKLRSRVHPDYKLLRAHTHQLQGVLAVLNHFLKPIGSNEKPSLLLADDVGVGKTLQVLMVLALLSHYTELQSTGKPLPPVFRYNPGTTLRSEPVGFAGQSAIPDSPSLIIAPITLATQWAEELKRFFMHGGVDIFLYNPGKHQVAEWWEKFDKSQQPPHRRIIVATIMAVRGDYRAHMTKTSSPYAIGKVMGSSTTKRHLFNTRFLIVAADEIHLLRTLTNDGRGVMHLNEHAWSVIGLTATPVFTSTKDIAHLGTIMRMPAFRDLDGKKAESIVTEVLNLQKEGKKKYGSVTDNKLIANAIKQSGITATKDQMNNPTLLANLLALKLLRGLMHPYTIRRTKQSRDVHGNLIISPMALTTILSFVKLSAYENKVWDEKASEVTEEHGKTRRTFRTTGFYTGLRRLLTLVKELPSPAEIEALTREDWEKDEARSSKLDRLVFLLRYHLPDIDCDPKDIAKTLRTALNWSNDGTLAPPPSSTELHIEFQIRRGVTPSPTLQPPTSTPPEQPLSSIPLVGHVRRTKVVIYCHWTSHLEFVKKILANEGFPVASLTGNTKSKDRAKILEMFNKDEAHPADDGNPSWILIISQIGCNGLNIARACVLIYLDQLWSRAEEVQTTGRLVRHGQKEDVIVYKILALNTTDIIMNGLALAKELMLDGFTNVEGVAKMLRDEGEGVDANSDVEMDDESLTDESSKEEKRRVAKDKQSSSRGKKKEVVKKKKSKVSISLSSDDDEQDVPSKKTKTQNHLKIKPQAGAVAQQSEGFPGPSFAQSSLEPPQSQPTSFPIPGTPVSVAPPSCDAPQPFQPVEELTPVNVDSHPHQSPVSFTQQPTSDSLQASLSSGGRGSHEPLEASEQDAATTSVDVDEPVDQSPLPTTPSGARPSFPNYPNCEALEAAMRAKVNALPTGQRSTYAWKCVELAGKVASKEIQKVLPKEFLPGHLDHHYWTEALRLHKGDAVRALKWMNMILRVQNIAVLPQSRSISRSPSLEIVPPSSESMNQSSSSSQQVDPKSYPIPLSSSGNVVKVRQSVIEDITNKLWEAITHNEDLEDAKEGAGEFLERFNPIEIAKLKAQCFVQDPNRGQAMILLNVIDWIRWRSKYGTANPQAPFLDSHHGQLVQTSFVKTISTTSDLQHTVFPMDGLRGTSDIAIRSSQPPPQIASSNDNNEAATSLLENDPAGHDDFHMDIDTPGDQEESTFHPLDDIDIQPTSGHSGDEEEFGVRVQSLYPTKTKITTTQTEKRTRVLSDVEDYSAKKPKLSEPLSNGDWSPTASSLQRISDKIQKADLHTVPAPAAQKGQKANPLPSQEKQKPSKSRRPDVSSSGVIKKSLEVPSPPSSTNHPPTAQPQSRQGLPMAETVMIPKSFQVSAPARSGVGLGALAKFLGSKSKPREVEEEQLDDESDVSKSKPSGASGSSKSGIKKRGHRSIYKT
ncbi:hypothetical protein FRC03_009393 [Tulasnella sp. 419]|nr:hypothetical protein FRC03_009393 [Tulasnella sp. 419]